MIRETVLTEDGKEITLLRPENAEDQAELKRLEAEGKFTSGTSMADNREDIDGITEQDLVDAGVVSAD